MAANVYWYGRAIEKALGKEINWTADEIKIMLLTSAFTPNQDTQVYKADITTGEVANGNGYTTGGQIINNRTFGTYDAVNNVVSLKGDLVNWPTSSITARWGVIYDNTPASNKPLIGYVDFGADMTSSNGDFKITWDATGILTITATAPV